MYGCIIPSRILDLATNSSQSSAQRQIKRLWEEEVASCDSMFILRAVRRPAHVVSVARAAESCVERLVGIDNNLRPANESIGRFVSRAASCMTVHFMDFADDRVVAYTSVLGKDRATRAGRVLVGRHEGAAIQADSVRVIANGMTEFLDRLLHEEGRYYFDATSFEPVACCRFN